jgi:hypothetical protein
VKTFRFCKSANFVYWPPDLVAMAGIPASHLPRLACKLYKKNARGAATNLHRTPPEISILGIILLGAVQSPHDEKNTQEWRVLYADEISNLNEKINFGSESQICTN